VISAVVTKVCAVAKGVLRRAIDAVKAIGIRIWDGIGSGIGGIYNWVMDKLW
jgi:hypothetical protein